jgi:hypothetical protein
VSKTLDEVDDGWKMCISVGAEATLTPSRTAVMAMQCDR